MRHCSLGPYKSKLARELLHTHESPTNVHAISLERRAETYRSLR